MTKNTTKTFPIVIDSWTEYERGWGSRPTPPHNKMWQKSNFGP